MHGVRSVLLITSGSMASFQILPPEKFDFTHPEK